MSKKSHSRRSRSRNVRRKTRRGGVKWRNILTGAFLFGSPGSANTPATSGVPPTTSTNLTYSKPAGPEQAPYIFTEPKFPVYTLPNGRPDPHPKAPSARGNAATLGKYPIIGRNNRGYTINTTSLFDPPANQQYKNIITFTTPEGIPYRNYFNLDYSGARPGDRTLRAYGTTNRGAVKTTLPESTWNFGSNNPSARKLLPKTLSGVTQVENINLKRGKY